MKKKFLLLVSIVLLFKIQYLSISQDNVGIGTTTPNASAILELLATDKGFLVPRLNTTQRDAISSPATGLLIYNTSNGTFEYYNGSSWIQIFSGAYLTLGNSKIFVGNSSNQAVGVDISGDATISNTGVLTISNDAITTSKIANSNVTDAKLASGINATKISSGNVSNTEFDYLDGVTSNIQTQLDSKIGNSLLSSYIFVGNSSNVATGVAMSGDATISNTGVLTVANDAITTSKIANSNVTDAKLASGINATKISSGNVSNTEFDYLDGVTSNIQTQLDSKMGNALTNSYIFVGNTSNVATGVAMSGDATISNTGVLTISNDAITTSKIANSNVTDAKLASGINATKISSGNVSNTEFDYLDGVTSNIQTQLDSKMGNALTNSYIFVGNTSNVATGVAMSGDATISNTGVLTISNDAITTSKIANSNVTDAKLASGINASKISSGNVSNTEFDYLDGVTSNIQTQLDSKMGNALTNSYIFVGNTSNVATGVAMSGDATISNTGVLTISNDAITTSKIANSNVTDAKLASGINATKISSGNVSNTEFDYLDGVTSNIQTQLDSKMGNALTNSYIFVGNTSNVATGVAVSGDATISNTGVLTIANNAITTAKISDNAVDGTKINLSGNTTGDLMYYNGTDWVRLAVGTSGQVLQSDGTNPVWTTGATIPSGTDKQTLRYSGTTLIATSNLVNDGTNIGIGITTPSVVLHQDQGDNTATYHKFTAGTTTGQSSTDGFDLGIDNSGNAIINQRENLNLYLYSNNSERLRIWNDGQIGINYTTSFDDSLRVWVNGDVLIDGDLVVTGNIDPISISLIPQNTTLTASEGTFFYDNNTKSIKLYDGTSWSEIGSKINSDLDLKNNDNNAKAIKLYEPSSSGNNYTAFKAQAQSNDIVYTLPASGGASNQFLKTDGSGNLSWADIPSPTYNIISITSDYNLQTSDQIVICKGSNNIDINLPSASSMTGKILYFKNTTAINIVTLIAASGETIDGNSTKAITTATRIMGIVSDGSEWYSIIYK